MIFSMSSVASYVLWLCLCIKLDVVSTRTKRFMVMRSSLTSITSAPIPVLPTTSSASSSASAPPPAFESIISLRTKIPQEVVQQYQLPSDLPDLAIIPNTDIVQFEGAENLGALLWAYTLYFGIFSPLFLGKSVYFGQPSEWVLIPLARGLGEDNKEWYQNFCDGVQYQVPPKVDFLRFGFFFVSGVVVNSAITRIFGGDLFWGWSTATCLSIPSTLLALFRPRRPSKEDVAVEESILRDFSEFAKKRLVRTQGKVCAESRIITSFRRSFSAYRTEEDISNKKLRKLIRSWVGYKANIEGDFVNLDMPSRKKEAEAAIALQRQISESRRSIDLLILKEKDYNDDGAYGKNDTSADDAQSNLGQDFAR